MDATTAPASQARPALRQCRLCRAGPPAEPARQRRATPRWQAPGSLSLNGSVSPARLSKTVSRSPTVTLASTAMAAGAAPPVASSTAAGRLDHQGAAPKEQAVWGTGRRCDGCGCGRGRVGDGQDEDGFGLVVRRGRRRCLGRSVQDPGGRGVAATDRPVGQQHHRPIAGVRATGTGRGGRGGGPAVAHLHRGGSTKDGERRP